MNIFIFGNLVANTELLCIEFDWDNGYARYSKERTLTSGEYTIEVEVNATANRLEHPHDYDSEPEWTDDIELEVEVLRVLDEEGYPVTLTDSQLTGLARSIEVNYQVD